MILRQLLHTDPVVAASYLFGCGGKGAGAVVDPVADPEFYLRVASELGLTIHFVIDTHVHADHLSTGPALARAAGAAYAIFGDVVAGLADRPLRDGDQLALGNVLVDITHVPGHTPEHIALIVTDRTRADESWLVFTGHTLMAGDMGRTELASTAEEGANALFDSAERLRALADHILVFPGAFSGSVCGRGLSGVPGSTIGFERRFNRAFAITERKSFVDYMLRDIPPRPPNAEEYRATNLGAGTVGGPAARAHLDRLAARGMPVLVGLALAAAAAGGGLAQTPGIVTVGRPDSGAHHVEPFLATNPANPRELVVAAMSVKQVVLSAWQVVSYGSSHRLVPVAVPLW